MELISETDSHIFGKLWKINTSRFSLNAGVHVNFNSLFITIAVVCFNIYRRTGVNDSAFNKIMQGL